MNNIFNEFSKTEYVFDRVATDVFELPYSKNQIQIQPNELAVASSFNIKLEKLYYNFLYLYGLCNIANFEFPTYYSGFFGLTGGDTITYTQGTGNTLIPTPIVMNIFVDALSSGDSGGITILGNAPYIDTIGIAIEPSRTLLDNNFFQVNSSFAATSFMDSQGQADNNLVIVNKYFISIFGFTPTFEPIFITEQNIIDPLSGTLYFQDICGVATDTNKTLFVADKILNNVYSYDLRSAVSDDYIRSGKLFLKDTIGGLGGRYDSLKFNNVNRILFTGDVLIVEDVGNKCFKVYDRNLNWINTTVAITLFNTVTSFQALAYNKKENNIYGVRDGKLHILSIQSNYEIVSSTYYDYQSLLDSDEYFTDIKFSNYNDKVFYLLSNKKIFKKWTTKPFYNIGLVKNSRFGGKEFKWLTTSPGNSGDDILLFAAAPDLLDNTIATFKDDINVVSLLKNNYFNIYTVEDIKINPQEYIQSWVYNKSFKKFLYNMIYFNSNISYRFFEGFDELNTPIFIKRGYNNFFLQNDPLNVNTFSNIFVNENFQSSVLNRGLEKIYDYQQDILSNIISNENVTEDLSPRRLPTIPINIFDYITYEQGLGGTIVPTPISMLRGVDGFESPDNSVIIVSLAPYSSGGGINII